MKKLLLSLILICLTSASWSLDMEKEVHISRMNVTIDVIGSIAFTTYDMEIYNPNQRQMEYAIILTLSPAESVVDYKLIILPKF